jgi:hypothetical protein
MSLDFTIDNHQTEFRKLFKQEQATMLARSARFTLIFNSVVACLMVIVNWKIIPKNDLMLWISAILITNAIRFTVIIAFNNFKRFKSCPEYFLKIYQYGALLSGCLWACIFIIPDQNWWARCLYDGVKHGALLGHADP